MLISSGENDKEMFFKSIDMHDKLKKLVNNSELEIRFMSPPFIELERNRVVNKLSDM